MYNATAGVLSYTYAYNINIGCVSSLCRISEFTWVIVPKAQSIIETTKCTCVRPCKLQVVARVHLTSVMMPPDVFILNTCFSLILIIITIIIIFFFYPWWLAQLLTARSCPYHVVCTLKFSSTFHSAHFQIPQIYSDWIWCCRACPLLPHLHMLCFSTWCIYIIPTLQLLGII